MTDIAQGGSEKPANMYERGVGDREVARLESFDYPNHVSKFILDRLQYNAVIDAGCGVNTTLAEYVAGKGKIYIGLDSGRQTDAGESKAFAYTMHQKLAALNLERARAYQIDIRDGLSGYKIPKGLVHMRFVLMHMSQADREVAMNNLLDLADQHMLFMEYDWAAVRSTDDKPLLDRFMALSFAVMETLHVDPHIGRNLFGMVTEDLVRGKGMSVKQEMFVRPEGDYTSELMMLTEMQAQMAGKVGLSDIQEEFLELKEALSKKPVRFVPAQINTVLVTVH